MKKFLLFISVPILLFSGELKNTLMKAKREHKPVMVYVKAESCTYCQKMKKTTLSDGDIQQNIQDFIFVEVDKADAEAIKYLPVTQYTPTIYFISPKFKVVNTVKGYLPKDDFNLWINDSKSKLGILGTEEKSVEEVFTTKGEDWFYDMASAEDYARQTGKEIMVYVENRRSSWSQRMRQETLSDERIKEALNQFVWVKLEKKSAEALSHGFTPKLAPTVYFRKVDGTELATAKGYFSPKDFLLWVNYAKGKM